MELLFVLQYIGIAILLAELFYILTRKPSRVQVPLLCLVITILINFIGYTFEMHATTKEMALQAVKFLYCGKPFISFFMFVLVMRYCNLRIPRITYLGLAGMHGIIILLVMTSDYQHLYYKTIDFVEEGLFPHLVFTYGPVYVVYHFAIVLYLVAILTICFMTKRKMRLSLKKKQINCFIAMSLVSALSLLVYVTGITKGYDCTLTGYLIATIILSVSIFKLKIVDTIALAKDVAMDFFSDAVLVCDDVDQVRYMNRQAKAMFLKNRKERAKEDVIHFLNEKIEKEYGVIHMDQSVYAAHRFPVEEKGVYFGASYLLHDITDSFNYTNRLQVDIEEKTEHIQEIQRSVTLGMASVIENRDMNTGGHVKRTSDIIRIYVEELKKCHNHIAFPERFYNQVINAAPMHDLGKIAVNDEILRKPGKYTPEEYAEMKTHSEKGADLVRQVLGGIEDKEFLQIAVNIAHYHHEKWDGTGYPCGLKGEEIPMEARIMALADVFDALVSKRCYKEAFNYDQAFEIIRDSLGKHFDPDLGEHFLECRDKLTQYYDQYKDE